MNWNNWALLVFLVIFNSATIMLISRALKIIDIADAVKEKKPTPPAPEVLAAKMEVVKAAALVAAQIAASREVAMAPQPGAGLAPDRKDVALAGKAAVDAAKEVKAAVAELTPVGTSYSRVTGLVGAMVVSTFFWGIGNVILYRAMLKPEGLEAFISSLWTFFVGGASLFLPYAFNQAKDAMTPNKP